MIYRKTGSCPVFLWSASTLPSETFCVSFAASTVHSEKEERSKHFYHTDRELYRSDQDHSSGAISPIFNTTQICDIIDRFMQALILAVSIGAVAQMFVLYLCWKLWHEHTFKLHKRYQAHMSIDMLRIHDNFVTVDGLAELLLDGQYGALNPAQRDLLHTIRKACAQAGSRLKDTIRYAGEESTYE